MVTLRVKPWADILVDGRIVATSSKKVDVELAVGTHILTFRNPAAKDVEQPIEIRAATEHLEETPLPVQPLVPAGKPAPGDFGGEHAVLSCPRHVQRLAHRAEVHPDASRQARGDRQHVMQLHRSELQQLRRRRSGAERANGSEIGRAHV